jgi:C4-dicarboxylate-specific signal transduction histidine kinase
MPLALAQRYLVPILFVVLLGAGLTTAISHIHTRQAVEDLAVGRMSQALGFLDRQVNVKVEGIEADVTIWSQEEHFRQALSEPGAAGLKALRAADKRLAERVVYQGYDRVFLAARDGNVLAASSLGMVGSFSVGDRAYFKRALAGSAATETLDEGRYSGRPVYAVGAPVHALDSTVAGALVAVVDILTFSTQILDWVRMGQTGGAYLLGPSGKVLAAPTWKNPGQFSPAPEAVKAFMATTASGVVRYESGGVERVALARANERTGWIVVVEADAAEILRPASELTVINGFISGAVLLLVCVALWELRKSIGRLRESEQRLQTLTEATPVGIATMDLAGRTLFMNQRARSILRINPGEAGSLEWTARLETREGGGLPPGELPMAKAMDLGLPSPVKTVWYRLIGGERAILALGAAPLRSASGGLSGVVAVIEDVTERTRIQEMMVQTEKMLSVGGLAAGMAHEINNPLASILQALQVVKRRLDPAVEANREKAAGLGLSLEALERYMRERSLDRFLADMHEAGVRAARIVTNMLGFARKSGGEYRQCDLAELLDRVVELARGDYDLKKQYDFKRIFIKRDYDPALPKVECQPMEIEQVLYNIFKNAAQALSDPPREDPPPRITLATRTEGGFAVVVIEDNGPGMEEDVRRRVFEPFFTTKAVGVGTGLGLSVAYFIVSENHKGGMGVESWPGKGTRFTVRLPVQHLV